MNNILFEVAEKSGRIIYLTKERWSHIQKHPEMSNQLERIKETLISPLIMREVEFDKDIGTTIHISKTDLMRNICWF